MDAEIIQRWIRNLGRTYDALVADGTIPNRPLTELYEGRDWLTLHVEDGIELSFWSETKRFETLYIGLLKSTPSTTVYGGELPKPFVPGMTRSSVYASFGEPMESKGPIKMPAPLGQTGGWDAYRLDPATQPNRKVVFQYTQSLTVKTLVFSLIDRGHD